MSEKGRSKCLYCLKGEVTAKGYADRWVRHVKHTVVIFECSSCGVQLEGPYEEWLESGKKQEVADGE